MAFKINKALAAEKEMEIKIPLNVTIMYQEDGEQPSETPDESMEVYHIMRLPVTSEREKHQQMMVKVKGQNVKAQGTGEASFWLWKQCMLRLENYDELPPTREQIIKVFEESTLLHIHAEKAAEALLAHINAIEGDISKK